MLCNTDPSTLWPRSTPKRIAWGTSQIHKTHANCTVKLLWPLQEFCKGNERDLHISINWTALAARAFFSFYRVWHNWWPVKKIVFGVSDDVSTNCNYVRQTARWMLFFWLSMLSFKSKEAFQVIKITFLLSWSMTPVMQHFIFIWDCKTYLRACVNKIIYTRPHILLKKTY